jgi:hypothetical protein
MKVDLLYVLVDTPEGDTVAAECSVCHKRFFDDVADGKVVRSAVEKFIGHADTAHHATGGIIGGHQRGRRLCA